MKGMRDRVFGIPRIRKNNGYATIQKRQLFEPMFNDLASKFNIIKNGSIGLKRNNGTRGLARRIG